MRTALPKDQELELKASLGLGPCQLGHLPHLRDRGGGDPYLCLHLKIVLQLRGNRTLLTGMLGTERDRDKKG